MSCFDDDDAFTLTQTFQRFPLKREHFLVFVSGMSDRQVCLSGTNLSLLQNILYDRLNISRELPVNHLGSVLPMLKELFRLLSIFSE